jgi:next-to-BRCA1 protein 1
VPTANILNEPPTSVKADDGVTAPQTVQAESRPSYLDTVLSYPPKPAAPSLPSYAPYRPAVYRSTALGTAMGLNNATTETLVAPPASTTAQPSTNVVNFCGYPSGAFCIDCNHCGKSIPNEHYHCSICDAGDFDLCRSCVDQGITCDGEEHWLIKRSIKDGRVIPSVTETIAPKKAAADKTAGTQDMKESVPPNEDEDESIAERTCNSCIRGN